MSVRCRPPGIKEKVHYNFLVEPMILSMEGGGTVHYTRSKKVILPGLTTLGIKVLRSHNSITLGTFDEF